MLPRGPRGVVEGGLDSMIGRTCVCHLVGCGVHPLCVLPHCECSPRLPALPTRAKGEGASIEECWCWVLWSYGAARLGTQAVVVELTSWLTFFFSRASENRAFRLGNRFNWFEIRLRPQTAYALPVKPHTSHTKVPHTHTRTLLSDHDARRGGRPGARNNGPQGSETTKGTTNGRHQARSTPSLYSP
eukprot:scaffold137184_cov166-Phaeocystis_antarctica.AAC.1